MEEQQPLKKEKPKKPENRERDFARYSGMVFQMISIILITTWGGIKLDELCGFDKPVFKIILSLLGVFAAIYTVLKDFIK